MPQEIEAKMKLADASERVALQHRIVAAGAKSIGTFFERNQFLDSPGKALLEVGAGLRLRVAQVSGSDKPMVVLTYKGPRQPGEMKSREEIELNVDDADAAIALLSRLGYQPSLLFEKRRQSWRLDRCRIELDEVPHLGHFVEIEGPDEPTVMAVRQQLQLADHPMINEGYVNLLVEHLRQRHDRTTQITFSS